MGVGVAGAGVGKGAGETQAETTSEIPNPKSQIPKRNEWRIEK